MWQLFRQIVHAGIPTEAAPEPSDAERTVQENEHENENKQIQAGILAILGRALCIREVDAGSCNGCELEIQALSNPYYNIEGLGIKFVASPRHADMLMVTGPVSRNMEAALKLAYDAIPHPKLVVAIGECACTGGVFGESYASCGRVSNVIPVDITVPGCPPPPIEILRGILTAISAKAIASDQADRA